MTDKLTLLILGAGCSARYDYPLAADLIAQLTAFLPVLGDNCPRLRSSVAQTLELFGQFRAKGIRIDTLDELSSALHEGRLWDLSPSQARQKAFPLVEAAKIAVAAMFLSKEPNAIRSGLGGYNAWLKRIFAPDYGGSLAARLQNTPYRVLTFNYDRLFELAFRHYLERDKTSGIYGPSLLNSGARALEESTIRIEPARFCLLKMHGSVGWRTKEHPAWGLEHWAQDPDPTNPAEVSDTLFFGEGGDDLISPKTLIVFPHERSLPGQFKGNRLPYRVYVEGIKNASLSAAGECKEIWAVGYSFHEADFGVIESILNAAVKCERLVVQNPHAEEIYRRLRVRHRKWADRIEPYVAPFEAG